MSDLQERMDAAMPTGDRIKQADLINREFIMLGVRDETYNSTITGKEETCYVADIIIDGEQHEAWMGGMVMGPIGVMRQDGAFPIKLREVKDGQRYRLIVVDENPTLDLQPSTDVGNGTHVSVGTGGQSAQERCQELFDAAKVAKSDDELLALITESDAGGAVIYGPGDNWTFNASKLDLATAVRLNKALG